ncbi:putative PEP-CTERM system TPR-repeat lipoprotein [Luteitalea pratensis]|uniref:Putative PEP-CTERM system TPR-repeat lipoprotein n=1 Tax=Luteitalea pratensis TaxID=1855912 RepID=A0A143PIM6_LUTPR|nr:tetratricopeptide repeat protein [Luteitalea pratensis]AMY07624.1 putative PEP-CTERM system TPR-repeat lipoprotein [Luteitalea pratensis]
MKALSLDPELVEVHSALGALLWTDWDFSGAEKAYTRAIELNPNYADARHMYAHLLLELGRIDEALRECQAYLALDPVSDAPMIHIVGHHAWAREYDDAIAWGVKLRQLHPDAVGWNLCEAYYGKGEARGGRGMHPQAGRWCSDTNAGRRPQVGVRTRRHRWPVPRAH